MSKKLRLIKTSIYVKHDQFNELEGVDFDELQDSLKQFISKKDNGKDWVSIVRVFPTLASSNTVDVELTAFNEEIDFISETNATDGLVSIIENYIDLEISHLIVKQTNDPLEIRGDLE